MEPCHSPSDCSAFLYRNCVFPSRFLGIFWLCLSRFKLWIQRELNHIFCCLADIEVKVLSQKFGGRDQPFQNASWILIVQVLGCYILSSGLSYLELQSCNILTLLLLWLKEESHLDFCILKQNQWFWQTYQFFQIYFSFSITYLWLQA